MDRHDKYEIEEYIYLQAAINYSLPPCKALMEEGCCLPQSPSTVTGNILLLPVTNCYLKGCWEVSAGLSRKLFKWTYKRQI